MTNSHPHPCSDGLVVIAPGTPFREAPPDIPIPARSLDHAEVAAKFKGLSTDRRPWPIEDDRIDRLCGDGGLHDCGLVPLSQLAYVAAYFARARQVTACDLLYCQPLASWDETELRESDQLSFLGYDYGYYLGAEHHFSAVHDDVMYGRYRKLRAYARHLNEALLLPTLELAHDLHHDRTELIHHRALLEHDESFIPIAIFDLPSVR